MTAPISTQDLMQLLERGVQVISYPLFKLGGAEFSVLKIAVLIGLTILVFKLSGHAQKLILGKALQKVNLSRGNKYAIAALARYAVMIVGLVLVLAQAGIDLSTLTVALGALGVGIGFGLQNMTNNFVSGLLILFEKPIATGDRVQVDDIEGNVDQINLRATTVVTNDNVTYIIPNSEFISQTVINWSHGDRKVRRRIPVGVAYQEDPKKIEKLLLEVALETSDVLKTPAPDVLFTEFGDSSLNFQLRVWTDTLDNKPGVLVSRINFAIAEKFREHNVTIPYPQRDIHIKEQP